MGPGRRHTRSAGIISGTGVQKWTRPINSLPYLTLPYDRDIDKIQILVTEERRKNICIGNSYIPFR